MALTNSIQMKTNGKGSFRTIYSRIFILKLGICGTKGAPLPIGCALHSLLNLAYSSVFMKTFRYGQMDRWTDGHTHTHPQLYNR